MCCRGARQAKGKMLGSCWGWMTGRQLEGCARRRTCGVPQVALLQHLLRHELEVDLLHSFHFLLQLLQRLDCGPLRLCNDQTLVTVAGGASTIVALACVLWKRVGAPIDSCCAAGRAPAVPLLPTLLLSTAAFICFSIFTSSVLLASFKACIVSHVGHLEPATISRQATRHVRTFLMAAVVRATH
jgi:hypothetical protein